MVQSKASLDRVDGMKVIFKSKDFPNFEKIQKLRSEWAEEVVKHFFESKGYRTCQTSQLDKTEIEKRIQMTIDSLFKNKDFHSVDVISVIETEGQRITRKKDEKL